MRSLDMEKNFDKFQYYIAQISITIFAIIAISNIAHYFNNSILLNIFMYILFGNITINLTYYRRLAKAYYDIVQENDL
jgi:fatty-acid desaturase